jgi:DNA-binding NarL/FixJ family response regulator
MLVLPVLICITMMMEQQGPSNDFGAPWQIGLAIVPHAFRTPFQISNTVYNRRLVGGQRALAFHSRYLSTSSEINLLAGEHVAKSMVRVLLVDDFESFRRFVASAIATRSELQIIGEASDGLEAVEKAEELQPDLILLDIGLPMLNGIEAAQRIRKRCPHSKILVISADSSMDVVRGALATGASGYLVKSNAGRELLNAIDAVLRGEEFLGSRRAKQDFSSRDDRKFLAAGPMAAVDSRTLENCNPGQHLALPKANGASNHRVHFYSKEASLENNLASFIGSTLKAGNAAIVLATEPHRQTLLLRLRALGLDIDTIEQQGRYIALDAADTLSALMMQGVLDSTGFQDLCGNVIVKAANAGRKKRGSVAIFGECVDILLKQGNAEAAIQMEKLGNQLVKEHNVEILCGYSLAGVHGLQRTDTFGLICDEHSAIYCG